MIITDLPRDMWQQEAEALADQHDAAKQAHGYERCEHCHFTRHPCEVYELAQMVLTLLEEQA